MPRSSPDSASTSRPPDRPRSGWICRQSKKFSGHWRSQAGRASSHGRRGEARQPVGVGGAGGDRLPRAVGHGHARARHRPRAVERRHPDERCLTTPLEMHREIGDQRRGRHVHRSRRSEECGAEPHARQLDDVEPRRAERDADHLRGLVVRCARQLDRTRRRRRLGAGEDRARPRRDGDAAQPVERIRGRDACDAPAHPELAAAGVRLQIAHRDGQRRVGLRLDDAEPGGELRERRLAVDADGEREAGAVLERAARVVDHVGRELDVHGRVGRERRRERQIGRPVLVLGRSWRPAVAVGPDQRRTGSPATMPPAR